VGIVDDHPSIVAALTAAIERTADLEVAGTAATYDESLALALGRSHRSIDVLVCDVQLAGGAEGLRLLDSITGAGRHPAVLLLSAFDQPSLIRSAIERGAAGYLVKTADLDQILEAIRIVAAGGTAFTAIALRSLHAAPRRPSDREIEVIAQVAAGASNAEVAARLGLSEKTIESHLRRLFDRYGLLSRTELAVLALDEGWIADVRSRR
jgi:DNA-binding NarL/FixJ family response regulator